MSMHEAREFVRNNRNTCLILCRTLACNSSFENAPKPFCDLSALYDHEFTSSMFIIILWFMSWTSVYTCEKAKEFIKHVNNLRQSDKILKSTRDQTYDDSVTINLAHLKLSFDTMTLTCQSGREETCDDSVTINLAHLKLSFDTTTLTCQSGREESDDDLSPADELLMALESENRSELFHIMRNWNFHSTGELTSMENFIRRLETIPIIQLPIQHRADFRRICELAYTEYYIMFVTMMVQSMNFHDLRPQSGKEDDNGFETMNESSKEDDNGFETMNESSKTSSEVDVEFKTQSIWSVSSNVSKFAWTTTFAMIAASGTGIVNPIVGLALVKQAGAFAIVSSTYDVGCDCFSKLNVKLKPQSGMETMRESLDQPGKLDNEGSKSLKTEPEQQAKQAAFRLFKSQPAQQLSNVDNIAGLNLQVQAVTAKSGMFRCTHNNIK